MIAINPNTVFKAYRELEMLGLVVGRTGSGTFVSTTRRGLPTEVQTKLLNDLQKWINEAKKAGLDDEAIEALIGATLHNFDKER
jgi:GntR family transcriptional regulator